jgi:hypothetical protein
VPSGLVEQHDGVSAGRKRGLMPTW